MVLSPVNEKGSKMKLSYFIFGTICGWFLGLTFTYLHPDPFWSGVLLVFNVLWGMIGIPYIMGRENEDEK